VRGPEARPFRTVRQRGVLSQAGPKRWPGIPTVRPTAPFSSLVDGGMGPKRRVTLQRAKVRRGLLDGRSNGPSTDVSYGSVGRALVWKGRVRRSQKPGRRATNLKHRPVVAVSAGRWTRPLTTRVFGPAISRPPLRRVTWLIRSRVVPPCVLVMMRFDALGPAGYRGGEHMPRGGGSFRGPRGVRSLRVAAVAARASTARDAF
jgi:hypothetical protein